MRAPKKPSESAQRSFIGDLSRRGRRTLGRVRLTTGDVKWAFDRAADPKPIGRCREATTDIDQRRNGARTERKKRRRRAAAKAQRPALEAVACRRRRRRRLAFPTRA
jgi:hypothetical protein